MCPRMRPSLPACVNYARYALSIMGQAYTSNCPFGNGNGYGDGRAVSVGEVLIPASARGSLATASPATEGGGGGGGADGSGDGALAIILSSDADPYAGDEVARAAALPHDHAAAVAAAAGGGGRAGGGVGGGGSAPGSSRRWELQLKGAGPTPFCRGADGRAVLRSSVREATTAWARRLDSRSASPHSAATAAHLAGKPTPCHRSLETHRPPFSFFLATTNPSPSCTRWRAFVAGVVAGVGQVREFLASELMHHLGVPTTRALCLVVSDGDVVRRNWYSPTPPPPPPQLSVDDPRLAQYVGPD